MGKIRRWLCGMVEVRIASDQIERFLNLCRNREIQLYQILRREGCCFCRMSLADYRRIRPVARKLRFLPLITGRKGLPFWIGECRKRKVYTGGFFLFVLLIFFLTRMIWSIDIDGCYRHTEEALLEFLAEQNVCCGMFYKNLDYKRTEDLIRLTYQDISWVSVERVGTRLHIRIKESNLIDTGAEEKTPSHLVASRDGVVKSIVTRSGTPMVQAGAEVQKGDILISGVIEVTGDYDAPVSTHLVYADGDVEISAEQSYCSVMEMEYEKKVYTGKKRTGISLRGFGCQVDFFVWGQKTDGQEDRLTEECILRLNPSLSFPVSLLKTRYREYETVRLRHSDEAAVTAEEEKFSDYLTQLEKKGVLILKNNVKIEVDGAACIAKGTVNVCYTEKRHRKIQENEWRETEPDEYNGNDS